MPTDKLKLKCLIQQRTWRSGIKDLAWLLLITTSNRYGLAINEFAKSLSQGSTSYRMLVVGNSKYPIEQWSCAPAGSDTTISPTKRYYFYPYKRALLLGILHILLNFIIVYFICCSVLALSVFNHILPPSSTPPPPTPKKRTHAMRSI